MQRALEDGGNGYFFFKGKTVSVLSCTLGWSIENLADFCAWFNGLGSSAGIVPAFWLWRA